ncbi:hypothetical protein QJS66_17165 [Kocuria rhizophila]|nr:hypothetical protein QJS66_17165 [Kocuria rhizophila]
MPPVPSTTVPFAVSEFFRPRSGAGGRRRPPRRGPDYIVPVRRVRTPPGARCRLHE